MKALKRQNGIGLVEVIIALGLMSAVAIGIISMFESQQKQIRTLLQKQDVIELKNIVLRQFADINTCSWQTWPLRSRLLPLPAWPPSVARQRFLRCRTLYNPPGGRIAQGDAPFASSPLHIADTDCENLLSTAAKLLQDIER